MIVAVKPREPFARYFAAATDTPEARAEAGSVKSGSDGGRTLEKHRIEIRAAL